MAATRTSRVKAMLQIVVVLWRQMPVTMKKIQIRLFYLVEMYKYALILTKILFKEKQHLM